MRYSEILTEMPELIDATDFNLMAPRTNATLTKKLMSVKNKSVIEENDNYILFRTGTDEGHIALVDKRANRLDYWVRFETKNKKIVGKTVTQVMLWRNGNSPWVVGITRRVIFDYLLMNWPAIMSDKMQTPRGKEFWRSIMAYASVEDYSVGLVDILSNTVEWLPADVSFPDWITGCEDAWGDEHKHQSYRFIIAI